MLDYIIYFILKYTYIISAVIFLLKVFLFLRYKNKNWRFGEFLYFNQINIKYTSTVERAKMKRTQNALSIIIVALLFLQLLSLVLFPS